MKDLPSIRLRLASLLYEALLQLGVLAVTFLVPHILLGLAWHIVAPSIVLLAHVFAVLACYFLWYWRHGGKTLAMQTWKLRLVAVNGQEPTWRQLCLRYLLAWPSLLFYGAGLFWAVFDRDRQFLHDRLAGTRIVFG